MRSMRLESMKGRKMSGQQNHGSELDLHLFKTITHKLYRVFIFWSTFLLLISFFPHFFYKKKDARMFLLWSVSRRRLVFLLCSLSIVLFHNELVMFSHFQFLIVFNSLRNTIFHTFHFLEMGLRLTFLELFFIYFFLYISPFTSVLELFLLGFLLISTSF